MNRPEEWLISAELDLRAAKASLKEGVPNIACFLSQQAAEKVLKAAILTKNEKVPKVHALDELLNLAQVTNPKLKEFENEILFLDKFYVPTRYPDAFPGSLPEGLPSKETAQHAIELAQEVLDNVKSALAPKT